MMSEVFIQIFSSITPWCDITSLHHQNTSLLIIHFSTLFYLSIYSCPSSLNTSSFFLVHSHSYLCICFNFILQHVSNCGLKIFMTLIQATEILQKRIFKSLQVLYKTASGKARSLSTIESQNSVFLKSLVSLFFSSAYVDFICYFSSSLRWKFRLLF